MLFSVRSMFVLYPVQGELGSDPCMQVFLAKLSDTESSFRYRDGFFADRS